MRKAVAGVGLAAGAALALSACGGQPAASGGQGSQQGQQGSQESQQSAQQPSTGGGNVLAAAYHATQSANSAKIALNSTTGVGGKTVHVNGHGVAQFKPPKLDLHISAAGHKTEERLLDKTAYVKTSQGKWLKVDLSKLVGRQGAAQSPTETLSYLRGASDQVTKLGPKTIDGTKTTGYKATVDLDKVASKESSSQAKKGIQHLEKLTGSHTLPIKVWIDGKHRVVREKINLQLHARGKNITSATTVTFTDYGTPVHVTKPPASQITSVPASIPPTH
jgi:hypothetical protein